MVVKNSTLIHYNGRYGDWKRGDRFDYFGEQWTVGRLLDGGKTLACYRDVPDQFGKLIRFPKNFPLSSMNMMRRL